MANMLNFKFGQFGSLKDQSYSAGTVYVTTDEQAMYIDLPKSHEPNAEITRVRIGDIIVKESSRDAEPPFSNGAFYYFVEENALLRWNNGEWKQINSVSDVQASIKQVEDTITNTILPKFNNYLLLEGGVMSGDIDMGNKTIKNVLTPVQEADAANKKYVDDGLATKVNVSDFNTFKTANSSAIEEAKKAGTDAQETISKSVLPKFDNYLLLDGGEMKGNITMGTHKITTTSSPSNNNDVTNKQYVDGQVNTRVLSSDFETFKTTNSTAIADAKKEGTEAKELIQNTVLGKFEEYLPLSGGEMSGSIDMGTHKITVSSAPSQTTDLTNKQYVDTEVGKRVLTSDFNTFKTTNSANIAEAKKAGTDAQSTITNTVLPKFNNYLLLEGGTMDGSINMGNNAITNVPTPTDNNHAVNKKYVDDVIAANDAMTFKGVLGNGTGQIASLPSTANVGDTYKVGVANTYGGNAAKVGDLIINAASKDSDAPNWVHISSGYEDDYLQKIVVDENTIHLTNGVDNTATGSVGGFTIVGDTNSNLVFTVSASTEDPAIHTITASMVWGTFN